MSVVTPETPIALKRAIQQPLYFAITLEVALTNVCKQNDANFDGSSFGESDTLMPQQHAFSCFVNKLAQVCDNRRRGKTITSFVVLQGDIGPVYVFGSNRRKDQELVETQAFVSSLLKLVGQNPTELGPKPLEKQVLWRILFFNLSRIEEYLDGVNKYLEKCMEDCQRKGSYEGKHLCLFVRSLQVTLIQTALGSKLQEDLQYLKARASFSRDVLSSENAKNKCK